MKYIDADKLIAEIEKTRREFINKGEQNLHDAEIIRRSVISSCNDFLTLITSLQQEQQEGNLEYWLEHFGMPKENIDNCITQIAQGYGACRYLEGIQHGAEAVNELAKQEQPEVDLEKFTEKIKTFQGRYKHPEIVSIKGAMAFMARMFYQYPNVARQWYEQLPKATMD